jgi:hypothetical protein
MKNTSHGLAMQKSLENGGSDHRFELVTRPEYMAELVLFPGPRRPTVCNPDPE